VASRNIVPLALPSRGQRPAPILFDGRTSLITSRPWTSVTVEATMRKYRSQPLTAQRIKADGWDEWEGVNRPLSEPTVYEIDPADHWQKLGILGPDGRPIEYYAGPDVLGFLNFDEEEGEE
jgi:hypothetical protein